MVELNDQEKVDVSNLQVIAIAGPTCSGKTALSLALAQELGGEIVVCDSRAIYKGMDIGTAKPTKDEQKRVKHHALDLIEPDRFFTVAQYKDVATSSIKQILALGKIAIVSGGSGLYLRALLEGIDIPAVPPQSDLRDQFKQLAEEKGNQALYDRLLELDPITAQRLNPNDRVRIIRALEVSITAGRPFSELSRRKDAPFKTKWIGLCFEDRKLHKKAIEQRFAEQLQLGLLDEVEALYRCTAYRPVLDQAINYKEFVPYLEGKAHLSEVEQLCVSDNYQLARKQMIWFKSNPSLDWYKVDRMDQNTIVTRVIAAYKGN